MLDTYTHLWPDADEPTRSAIDAVIAEQVDSTGYNAEIVYRIGEARFGLAIRARNRE